MVYHWQSHSAKLCGGVDDMVLLPRPTEDNIVDNLKKRFMNDYIYTCIGPVLISVNPFKQMTYFGEKEIEQYQGAALYENPPHIYGLSDQVFRNLLIDNERQCIIISGESGAGKTVAARYIMNYISRVSGGSKKVQHVKDVVLNSNPLLEAFGNAKTIRNNNSSRFGKYVEIVFDSAGQPVGGRISNFLLEKSRISNLSLGERNFHIFYQLCTGAHSYLKKDLGIIDVDHFQYLSIGNTDSVEGVNDVKDFNETLSAMKIMGLSEVEQREIWNIIAGILHLGNVTFDVNGNYAQVMDTTVLEWPAYLLGINKSELESKLTSRLFESKWGSKEESVNVTLNVEQATYTRDALAKGIYSKLFDFLVQRVNAAMFTESRGNSIGILDIYGFEILEKNGFEQLCINFVNEKLQQIFIQLTLKAEQEEYVTESIMWTPVDFFNNQIVCELLEGRQPPGVFLVLDDVCATLHAVADGADQDLLKKLDRTASAHKHYSSSADGFIIKHYAGVVSYSVEGFCDRNRDVFYPDLIQLIQSSSSQLMQSLFPEPPNRTRPTTAGNKIRAQGGELVAKLMQCSPHYIRCIKPNENKRAKEWDDLRVKHQVEYLGLRENISVRQAGFAYRRPFQKFIQRYAILTKESWPVWRGNERDGVRHILKAVGYREGNEFQVGSSKIFIKKPESVFQLEEMREQHFDKHARIIQLAFKKHFARKQQISQREEAAALVHGRKERRKLSINRQFVGDYVGVSSQPELQALIGRREKVMFAIPVTKYDRRFKPSSRYLVVTSRSVLLISSEFHSNNGGNQMIVKRNIPFPNLKYVTLSSFQDNFVVLHVKDDYDSLLEIPMKTEFLYVLHKRYFTQVGTKLIICFANSVEFSVKKSGLGGGGTRHVVFVPTISDLHVPSLKISGNTLTVGIGAGLPANAPLPTLQTQTISKRVIPKDGVKSLPSARTRSTPARPAPPAPTRSAPPPPINLQPPPLATNTLNSSQKSIPQQNSNKPESLSGTLSTNFNADLTSTIQRLKSKSSQRAVHQEKRTEDVKTSVLHNDLMSAINSKKTKHISKLESNKVSENKLITNQEPSSKMKSVTLRDNSQRLNSTLDPQPASVIDTKVQAKPIPGGGRPRPNLKPSLPRAKAVYDYQAQDIDELTLKEGDLVDVIKEHPGGWWQGRLKGREGLFPANYVQKI